jgi:hypothetical protein
MNKKLENIKALAVAEMNLAEKYTKQGNNYKRYVASSYREVERRLPWLSADEWTIGDGTLATARSVAYAIANLELSRRSADGELCYITMAEPRMIEIMNSI